MSPFLEADNRVCVVRMCLRILKPPTNKDGRHLNTLHHYGNDAE